MPVGSLRSRRVLVLLTAVSGAVLISVLLAARPTLRVERNGWRSSDRHLEIAVIYPGALPEDAQVTRTLESFQGPGRRAAYRQMKRAAVVGLGDDFLKYTTTKLTERDRTRLSAAKTVLLAAFRWSRDDRGGLAAAYDVAGKLAATSDAILFDAQALDAFTALQWKALRQTS